MYTLIICLIVNLIVNNINIITDNKIKCAYLI